MILNQVFVPFFFIGPMVYGTCFSPLEEKDHLTELGLAGK